MVENNFITRRKDRLVSYESVRRFESNIELMMSYAGILQQKLKLESKSNKN